MTNDGMTSSAAAQQASATRADTGASSLPGRWAAMPCSSPRSRSPLVGIVAMVIAIANATAAIVLAKFGLPFAVVAFLIVRALTMRIPPPAGIELRPQDAAALRGDRAPARAARHAAHRPRAARRRLQRVGRPDAAVRAAGLAAQLPDDRPGLHAGAVARGARVRPRPRARAHLPPPRPLRLLDLPPAQQLGPVRARARGERRRRRRPRPSLPHLVRPATAGVQRRAHARARARGRPRGSRGGRRAGQGALARPRDGARAGREPLLGRRLRPGARRVDAAATVFRGLRDALREPPGARARRRSPARSRCRPTRPTRIPR